MCISLSLSLQAPLLTHLSTSLISRTLATRTVMSSMRNWILQLWLPLPAHGAQCTLAGTLSSMQPSSLAHTNACHCRPFPYDSGLKVHRLKHFLSLFHPFLFIFFYSLHSLTLSTQLPLCPTLMYNYHPPPFFFFCSQLSILLFLHPLLCCPRELDWGFHDYMF